MKKPKQRNTSLDDLYGACIPAECDVSLYTDIGNRRDLVSLFEEDEEAIVGLSRGDEPPSQEDDPFYGEEPNERFNTAGYEESVILLNAREDDNGNAEYYPAGRTKRWVPPKVA